MRYYLIAGEASGDLHGSHLMKALSEVDKQAEFRFWGGDLMLKEGGNRAVLVKHYRDLAFMGFIEVLCHLKEIAANLKLCKKDLLSFQPDAVIFIDYPGFNLKMAKFAKKSGFKTFYYISPKIWAWNESRIHLIKRDIDHMLVIFPFEEAFFAKHQYPVHFVGNPLMDEIEEKKGLLTDWPSFKEKNNLPEKPVIALLAGSRKQEVCLILREMIRVKDRFPEYQFIIAGVDWLPEALYAPFLSSGVKIVYGQTYAVLKHARAAMVTSGTATLETALLEIPQVVVYKASRISYFLSQLLVRIKFISLVNLIMDQEVVREIIQNRMPERISVELKKILREGACRQHMLEDYKLLQQKLGGSGASARAAEKIIYFLSEPAGKL